MSTDSDFTRLFPPWKSSTKASGIPACWLIIAENLEETFHRQNVAESNSLLHFRQCVNNVLQGRTQVSFKLQRPVTKTNLPDRKN